MDAESSLLTLSVILMGVGLIVAFIPLVPASLLLWVIGVITAYLEGFERIPVVTVVIMTLLMILGSTNELWMPLLGIRAPGGSCWSSLGAFAGSLLGTFLIPIPILGTVVGYVLGALVFELARLRELRRAIQAGRSALKTYFINYVVQLLISCAIFAVFVGSLWLTGRDV
jgi:uncharacterized protein YqgC (DUF456 family)